MRDAGDGAQPRTAVFAGADGQQIEAAYARIRDTAGLDWIIVTAVPRADFLGEVTKNFERMAIVALFASLLTVALGFMVLSVVAHDLRQLALAARRIGDGDQHCFRRHPQRRDR